MTDAPFDSITKITIPKDSDMRGAAAIIAVFVQSVADERSWPIGEFIDEIAELIEVNMRIDDPSW